MEILKYSGEGMKHTDKPTVKLILLITFFIALMIALNLIFLPLIHLISEQETQKKFKVWITSIGVRGWLLVLFLQIAQIVIAFIPGEPIEILAGILYGGFGGLFLCMFGCVTASFSVFMFSKRIGTPLAARLFKKNQLDKFAFLKDAKKLETIVFILFLIPGTPKDMLTYIVGTSPMRTTHFLVLSSFARIPSVISSTFIGSTLRQGEWEITIVIFAFTAVLGITGITYQEKFIKFCKNRSFFLL